MAARLLMDMAGCMLSVERRSTPRTPPTGPDGTSPGLWSYFPTVPADGHLTAGAGSTRGAQHRRSRCPRTGLVGTSPGLCMCCLTNRAGTCWTAGAGCILLVPTLLLLAELRTGAAGT